MITLCHETRAPDHFRSLPSYIEVAISMNFRIGPDLVHSRPCPSSRSRPLESSFQSRSLIVARNYATRRSSKFALLRVRSLRFVSVASRSLRNTWKNNNTTLSVARRDRSIVLDTAKGSIPNDGRMCGKWRGNRAAYHLAVWNFHRGLHRHVSAAIFSLSKNFTYRARESQIHISGSALRLEEKRDELKRV